MHTVDLDTYSSASLACQGTMCSKSQTFPVYKEWIDKKIQHRLCNSKPRLAGMGFTYLKNKPSERKQKTSLSLIQQLYKREKIHSNTEKAKQTALAGRESFWPVTART